ncbi:MAG: MvaI/BcnI family restriction endonuclease [Candidatus Thorarchaeota archaeon]
MPVTNSSPVFTEAELRKRITDIVKRGWIRSGRPGNDGSVGNTIEDLLGIPENNLQVADAGQFEIKGKRAQSDALLTLFHLDPGPKQKYPGRSRRSSPVQPILVDKFGWPHKQRKGENSFRLTINTHRETGREQLQTCNEPQRGNSEAHI